MELIEISWDSRYIKTDKRWHYQKANPDSILPEYQLYLDGRSFMAWSDMHDDFKKVADWLVKYQPDINDRVKQALIDEVWDMRPALRMLKAIWFSKRGDTNAKTVQE
jgi:hypothetical protein